MSAPSDPITSFIIQHNLLPYLWPSMVAREFLRARKMGSAFTSTVLCSLRGLEDVFGGLCDCYSHCRARFQDCRRRTQR